MDEDLLVKELLSSMWETEFKDGQGCRHLSTSEIYDLLLGVDLRSKDGMFRHLSRCPKCSRELSKMVEAKEETQEIALDIALPKLAAARPSGFVKVDTEGGKYTIFIRRSLKDHERGIITVQVSSSLRAKLEGTTMTLKDAKGRKLVKGKVINGEVSQVITDIDDIDMKRFMVECR